MKIIVAGLGRMGSQIARKLSENGHEVYAHNRSPGPVEEAVKYGAKPANNIDQALSPFKDERLLLWLMLPAEIVDVQLEQWLAKLPAGSIIIDGGNSDYRLTKQRAEKISHNQCQLLDSGTSGGIWGYKNGFSLMVGGDETAFKYAEPVFKTLSAPNGAYQHFGGSGAGHFVKMVHNAIEYGMMESLAEGYRMLKEGPYTQLDLAAAGNVWQHGSVINSWLNELARQALSNSPDLDGIDGVVAESGETRWTLETAKELNINMPAIQSAFDVRLASQKGQTNFATKLLAAMRNKFGGHDINPK